MRNNTRYVGAHVPEELHKLFRVRCVEMGTTMGEAIIDSLIEHFDIAEHPVVKDCAEHRSEDNVEIAKQG